MFAASFHNIARHFERLDTVDGFLHRWIEILHAEACAVEPNCRQLTNLIRRDEARIKFNLTIAIVAIAEMESCTQCIDDVGKLLRRQKIRRASTEMQLHHFTMIFEQRRNRVELFQ